MKRIVFVLSIMVVAMALMALVLSTASAAPSAPSDRFMFTKVSSNLNPKVGDIFTFTLNLSPTAQLTATTVVRVTDPNQPYLRILTNTILGSGTPVSPTFDGLARVCTFTVGTLPQQISFQVLVTGIPATSLATGHLVTNTAHLMDVNNPGTLPEQDAQASIRIMPLRLFMPVVVRQ